MDKKYNKVLKRIENKKNRELYIKYSVGVVSLCLCLAIGIYFTFSKFSVMAEKEVIRTTVADFTYEPIKKIAYINDTYVSGGFPEKDTSLTLTSVSCTNGATATFDVETWSLTITNDVAKTKCSVYFTK